MVTGFITCTKSNHGYHNDKDIITYQDDNYGIHQKCKCGTEIRIKKDPEGRLLDDQVYFDFHKKDYLQTGTKEFRRVYGIERETENNKLREKKRITTKEKQDLKAELKAKRKHYAPEYYKKHYESSETNKQ